MSDSAIIDATFIDSDIFSPRSGFDNDGQMTANMYQIDANFSSLTDSGDISSDANFGDSTIEMSSAADQIDIVPQNYNNLFNKPTIDGILLEKGLTLNDLHLREVYYDYADYWDSLPDLVSRQGAIYIYDKNGALDIKLGDGQTRLIDLPFIVGRNYGVCSTSGIEQIKQVTIPGLIVHTGTTIHVEFLNSNQALAPKLRVNDMDPKYMMLYGSVAFGNDSDATSGWYAGAIITLTYNGRYWVRDQGYNTNTEFSNEMVGNGYGTCYSPSTSLEKVVELPGYALVKGGLVTVHFVNRVLADSLMTINGQDSKYIYYRTAEGETEKIASGVIRSGDTATFIFNGTWYQLVSIDRTVTADFPEEGSAGDILTKTEDGVSWVTPASDFEGDNTRPITAAAVNTRIGNIDALLATI